MKDYFEFLTKTQLFAGISVKDIPILLERLKARVEKFTRDDYVRIEGDPADFIGIVLEGKIQILNEDYFGNRSITATFEKGALFGEAFSCAGVKKLTVDILSCADTDIMFIDSRYFLIGCGGGCEFQHTLLENLLKIMAKKNMLLNKKLQYSSHKTTSEKIMAYLHDQAKINHSPEFIIPYNRQELADFLGVERSAMSAEIGKLVKQGAIETKRSYFRLIK